MAITATKHAVSTGIGTISEDVLPIPVGYRSTLIGCTLTNTTDIDIQASIWVVDESSTAAYYIKDIAIHTNTSLRVITNGEKLVLPENTILRVGSNTDNSLDVVVSYVEIKDPTVLDSVSFTISQTAPVTDQVLTATSTSATEWQFPPFKLVSGSMVSIAVPTTPVLGQVLTLTSATDAQWKDPVLPEGFPGGGTVTSVGGTGTVNGLTLSGTVTGSGNLTLGGTLSNISLATQVTGTLAVTNGGTGVTTSTGTGSIVLSDSPTLVTPVLGTPASGNLANCTFPTLNQNTSGSAATLSATLAVNKGGTGVTTSTGTGNVVLSNAPVLVNPTLGTPVSGDLSNCTFPVLNQNTTGTAGSISGILTVIHGGTGTNQSTGSGKVVLSNAPVLVGPTLGTPVSGALTNCTGLPLSTGVTGFLSAANGGTGTSTATGSGDNVLSNTPILTSPTLITPLLGVPTSGVLTNCTGYTYANLSGTVPTWNQNTTGTAAGLSGTIPTWNQNTTGTAAGLSATLVVGSGGTGATTLTGILKGNGTSAFTAVTAPSGALVGTTDTQTVTNKTVTTVALYQARVEMAANDINLSLGNTFTKTITGATTLTVSNVPSAGITATFILDLTNGAAGAITWWGVKWVGGTAPTLTSAGRDSLGFFTHDGGTTWSGVIIGKDIK